MALFQNVIKRYRLSKLHAQLSTLTDRQLNDIGFSRADIRTTVPAVWIKQSNESWPAS